MMYRVSKLYSRGSDMPLAEFNEQSDAKLFIDAKRAEDASLRVTAKYCLYDGMELLEEFGPMDAASGTQQQSSTQSFRPTPFNAAPRPGGLPHNWVKEADKKDEDKK